MKSIRVFVICGSIVFLSLMIFSPRQLISGENASLQRIHYESERFGANELDISDDVEHELLDFLSECEIYQTLYTTDKTMSRIMNDSDNMYYLYIRIFDNKKSIGIHLFDSYSCIIVNQRPFYYQFLNADMVQRRIFEILKIS